MQEQVLLDLGNLPRGFYKVAVSRIGQGQDKPELERIDFHIHSREDGKLELSEDGNWSRYSSVYSDAYRKEKHYLQNMKDASTVRSNARVLDISEVLDTG